MQYCINYSHLLYITFPGLTYFILGSLLPKKSDIDH